MKKKIIIVFSLIFVINIGIAQEQAQHEKKTYTDEGGELYWNKELPVYITISPTANPADGHNLENEAQAKYNNPFYFDTEGINYIRSKWAVDKETGNVVIPKQEVLFPVQVDGIAPKSKSTFLDAPKYSREGKIYYGQGLNINIEMSDNLSGTQNLFYSLDVAAYQDYKDNLILNTEGEHSLKYYSLDNVGNAEKSNEKKFIVDITSPETYHTIVGITLGDENIVSTATRIFLNSTDNIAGVKAVYYKIDDGKDVYYNQKNIPISGLTEGKHTLTYYAIDNVENKETIKSFKFYLDRTAPILTSDILGDRFIVGDQIYFSGRTKLKLTAVDNKSGIKNVNYSVDNAEFSIYNDPFYLPRVPGYHIVKYYAIDNTENDTQKSDSHKYDKYKYTTEKIYVDLVGPTLAYEYVGQHIKTRDTVFINKDTKIKLKATDAESGLQYISYSINGKQEEIKYINAFTVPKSGTYSIEYFGYDNVNNRNTDQFYFVCDSDPPEPFYNFSIKPIGQHEGMDMYPSYVLLFLAATDATTGAKEIYYSINDANFAKYSGGITGFKSNSVNTVKIKVIDKLKNEQTIEIQFFIK